MAGVLLLAASGDSSAQSAKTNSRPGAGSNAKSAATPNAPLQLRPTSDNPEPDPRRSDDDDDLATGSIVPGSPAPSRIGQTPVYEFPSGAGSSGIGFDSRNRPGEDQPDASATAATTARAANAAPLAMTSTLPPRTGPGRTPISASVAGVASGQPTRRALRPDPDPFGAVGFYAGSFLVKGAVELSGGYSTNPGRFLSPRGSSFYLLAPELLIASDWSRHSLTADLRGSFAGYGSTFALAPGVPGPTSIDRPDFTGRINGRLDVTRDTRLTGELRSRIATDNPGSPNVQTGLSEYPLSFSNGISVGFEQDFNRLRLSASGLADRTTYQNSKLTDGTIASNADRNFSRYGGIGRASYELTPSLLPFIEVEGDTRIHDRRTDRSGYLRDSNGGYIKVGSSFEITRLLTGEAAIGYAMRAYDDPRLNRVGGLLTSGSLVWTPTGLTTIRFTATSSVDETTLAGVSGVMSRGYAVQVDHDFRRWLTGSLRFSYGTADYDGSPRSDTNYLIGGDLIYKMSRNVHVKASARHEWLDSTIPNAKSEATTVTLGVRLQR